jgi:drug/metabolite transporter (DMT)-like permease
VLVAIFNPLVLLGIVLLIAWLLTRMAMLSWADLTYVLPVTAFGYVVSAILGWAFLAETITPVRWAGTLLIVAGTVLVGLGDPHAEKQS